MILALMMAAAAATAQPVPAVAPRPDRFDLTCRGVSERQLYEAGNTNGGGFTTFVKRPVMDPWRGTFRVDMARGLWCQDKCVEVAQPAIAKPQVLVLMETDRRGARTRTVFETPDGTLLVLAADGTSILPVRGRCTLSAFTGIPEKGRRIGGTLDLKAEPYPQD